MCILVLICRSKALERDPLSSRAVLDIIDRESSPRIFRERFVASRQQSSSTSSAEFSLELLQSSSLCPRAPKYLSLLSHFQ